MTFQPSHIARENIRSIHGTPWRILRHTNNCFFLYHADYDHLQIRRDAVEEELHLTVFIQRNRLDYHATWVFLDRKGNYYKRHHGYRFRNGKRQFKNVNRPVELRSLFSEFERDMPYLEQYISRIMVSFNSKILTLKQFLAPINFQKKSSKLHQKSPFTLPIPSSLFLYHPCQYKCCT